MIPRWYIWHIRVWTWSENNQASYCAFGAFVWTFLVRERNWSCETTEAGNSGLANQSSFFSLRTEGESHSVKILSQDMLVGIGFGGEGSLNLDQFFSASQEESPGGEVDGWWWMFQTFFGGEYFKYLL